MNTIAVEPNTPTPMRRTRVKFCGLSRQADVAYAIELGVDAIGLVFYPPSARALSVAQALELTHPMPPFISVVGLFVNPTPDWFAAVTRDVPLTMLQFHGDETPQTCEQLAQQAGLPWLRAVRVQRNTRATDLIESAAHYSRSQGVLLDAHVNGYGGSGQAFDWSVIPVALAHQVVLSGGLNVHNVGQAIHQVRPYAVDVSSGIEMPGAKGVKDHALMAAFMRAVREANAC